MNTEKLFSILSRLFLYALVLFIGALGLYLAASSLPSSSMMYICIVALSLFIFFSFRKDTLQLRYFRPVQKQEHHGKISALAIIIKRASKGYDVSKKQVDVLLSYIEEEEITVEGKGDHYIKNIKELIT